jgi:predicted ABC-class ATPase
MGELEFDLQALDGRSYKAYRDLRPCYSIGKFTILFDRIQGDPFASPSQCRIIIPQNIAKFPETLFSTKAREIALRDYLTRQCYRTAHQFSSHQGSGKSGSISVAKPSQGILERSAVLVNPNCIELRFTVGLPAWGRQIAGREAIALLCQNIPQWIEESLLWDALDGEAIQHHIQVAEDAIALRAQLKPNGWVAFIANGAILPRDSGVSDRPLQDKAQPFIAPKSLEVTLDTPHSGAVTGLAIPEGVTLIVGGGFHGKSTVLQGLQLGIYNHIPGDGRERVVSLESAMKIRSEEGRSVQGVDLSPFINNLPFQASTASFCTNNASGSTSQAASIMEAIEAETELLLLDEDTCATNFMIRDRRMQSLINAVQEPITPLIDQVQNLYNQCGISSILVIGGCGDYFDVADTVIALNQFVPEDKTAEAKAIAQQFPSDRDSSIFQTFESPRARYLKTGQSWFRSPGDRRLKTKVYDLETLEIGDQRLDLSGHEQWIEIGQLRAIALCLIQFGKASEAMHCKVSIPNFIENLWEKAILSGIDSTIDFPDGNLAFIRKQDFYFALNRLRSLEASSVDMSRQHNLELSPDKTENA